MNKCFYELNLKDSQKFGISFINKEGFVNRANNYQALFVDYVKFKNILLIDDIYYDKIENIFSFFIKKFNYGKRLNYIRKNCEIYEININNIMEVFYDYIKNKINCKLLTTEELNKINQNYKNHLFIKYENNEEKKEDYNDFFEEEKKSLFKFRDYQQEDIDKWNGDTGILCYHTGLGKTITVLGMINKYFNIINKNTSNICFWITKKIDILRTQKEDFEKMKRIFNFNIIDNISGKNTNKLNIKNDKINIILINIDSLDKIKNIITPNLCIFDECHSITVNIIYNYLKILKNLIPIIGLSATPIKLKNFESVERIKKIFGNDNKINYIGLLTYMDAINKDLVTPLRLKWINNINNPGKLNEKENIIKLFNYSKKNINNMIKNHNKIIFWTKTINESNILYKCLSKEYKNVNVYLSNSKNDKNCKNIMNFVKNNNKNKTILISVNRFKEGSNDKNLSCGVYFSYVDKQEVHVFLQEIGRLTRITDNKDIAEFYQLLDNKDIIEKENYIINNIIRYIDYLSYNDFNDLLIEQKEGKILFKSKNNKTFIEADFNDLQDFNQININRIVNNIKMNEKTINYDNFCELLKTNNIRPDTYQKFQLDNKNLNLPVNIYEKFPFFSWDIICDNNYINKNKYLELLYDFSNNDNIKTLIFENMLDENEILNEFTKIDKRIPNILPWLFYGPDINLNYYFDYTNYE